MLLFIKFHYVPNILINIVSIHLMLLFIMTPEYTAAHNDGFNTSHVTLYQKIATEIAKRYKRFNTSHVTLYQGSLCFSMMGKKVSIHLMLLFIGGLFIG